MNKSDWIIIVLGAANGGNHTPAQLQKSLFLIKENLPKEFKKEFYDFIPYNCRPFFKEIYSDSKKLGGEKLLNITFSKP